MSTHYMIKTLAGFEPADGAELPRIALGDVVEVTIKRSRNAKHNAKYWKLINRIFENQTYFDTPDELHQCVKHGTGYSKTKKRKNGTQYTVYESTSFEKMDQTAFDQYYDRVLSFVCTEVIPNMNPGEARVAIEDMLQ